MSDRICTYREALLRAASILDLLAIGWRPTDAELNAARSISHWATLPGHANHTYQVMGLAWLAPVRRSVIVASVIAIDSKGYWARIWDEWVSLDDGLAGAPAFDPTKVQQIAGAWLLREFEALSVH